MVLSDEEAIDNVNPFVLHDFSLPGSVRQSGSYDEFTEFRKESSMIDTKKSVYCDYGLCEDSMTECSLSRDVHPRRNIDTGFTKKKKFDVIEKVTIGVSNHPEFSIIGGSIILLAIALILYYARR